jgi:thiosulfate/3-mercaptopyruvate sulfurtransferase
MRDWARLLVVVLAVVVVSASARAEVAPLLTPQELAPLAETGSVVVLDVRNTDPDEGGTYVAGHIPGAISAPYPSWRGPAENPGRLPALATLESLVARAGIDGTKPVVLVHAGSDATDFGAAARVFWTLRYLGLDELAILNGGMAAWREAGLPLTTESLPVLPSAFEADVDPTILATRGEIEQSLAAGGEGRLLDARPQGFFWGKLWHDAAHRPGTIPSAQNFTHQSWFIDGGPVIVGPDEARRIALEAGLDDAPITVSFCNTGHWAATNWFALSELAGLPGVKLYPESVVDWSQAGLPMDHVPGRIEWLWLSTRKWFQQTFG